MDLYYRISTIPLEVPPLRDRAEDLPLLVERLLAKLAMDLGRGEVLIAPTAMKALQAHAWPGNIRELRNVLERALLHQRGRELHRADIPLGNAPKGFQQDSLDLTLAELESLHIARVLEAEDGHVERTAHRLGIPRSSLYQRLKGGKGSPK
jgi:DNA-binding NtrC family response regulator